MNSPCGFHAGSLRTRGHGRVQSVDTSRLRSARRMRRAHPSRRHRRVIEPTTVRLPAIRTETRAGAGLGQPRFWSRELDDYLLEGNTVLQRLTGVWRHHHSGEGAGIEPLSGWHRSPAALLCPAPQTRSSGHCFAPSPRVWTCVTFSRAFPKRHHGYSRHHSTTFAGRVRRRPIAHPPCRSRYGHVRSS